MKRRKIIYGLGILLILWLGVSTYFYVQHYVTIITCPVYQKVNFGEEAIYITELRWDNYEREPNPYLYGSEIPRYMDFIESNKVPMRVAMLFLKTHYFYSTPYIKYDDSGYLTVKGLILKDICSENDSDVLQKYEVSVHTGDINIKNRSGGASIMDGSNILRIYKRNKQLIPEGIENVEITIKDTSTDITRIIQVYPEWQSKGYSFFDPKPDEHEFAAETTAENFIELVQQNNIEKAEQLILTDLHATFPWHRLERKYLNRRSASNYMFYENNYGGFSDVYSCNINYRPEKPPSTEYAASQKIYLIYQKGQWKIIDVSPAAPLEI